MTSLKTVLLGSAAALVATGAAQAADLPVKKAAAAVAYVEVCPAYGAGFYKLPGTDICIRHFGSVKFGTGFQDRREFVDSNGAVRIKPAAANTTGWEWTLRPGWDFRSPTEWGTLRTVVQMRVDMRAGIFEDNDDIGGVGPNLRGTQRVNNMIHRGYIEWAGFTIGKVGSNFVYWDQDDVIGAIGGSPKESPNMTLSYTFAGAGWKAILALEDPQQWSEGYQDRPWRNDAGLNGRVNSRGPFGMPNVVLALSTEGPWGSAKVSGNLGTLQTARNSLADSDPAVNDFLWVNRDTGSAWAVLGGVTFMVPSLGSKDQLMLEATHCDGIGRACGGQGSGAADSPTAFERPGQYTQGLQRDDVDAYITGHGPGGWGYQNTVWNSFVAQYRHYWAPLWRSNIMGSYMKIDTPAVAKTLDLDRGGRGDAKVWDIGANLIWGQSRKTAEIGVEVAYKSLKQDLPNGMTQADLNGLRCPTGGTCAPGSTDKDPSGWMFMAFIQRNW
jgi:hypothetical protein